MTRQLLTIFATVALAGSASTAAFAQGYPSSSPGYNTAAPAPYPGGYPSDGRPSAMPDFDSLDDGEDDRGRGAVALSPPGAVMSPDDPRYGRPAGQPVYSGREVPQGPVMSPDDPRYGRPYGYGAPASGQAPMQQPAPTQAYGSQGYQGQGNAMRPPEGVGQSGQGMANAPAENRPMTVAGLPPEDQPDVGETPLPSHLRRQEVDFASKEPAGTIVVDTSNTYLYLILGNGRAMRYGVRVGRDGFTWNGTQKITRKAEWPDWHPPSEMIERQPYLPRFMAGGPGNPMGARAMYLGSTVYRIHGTNQPSTIGKFVSSGCIGMLNDDAADLYDRVKVGTRVVVLPGSGPKNASTASAQPAAPIPGTQPTSVQPLPAPVTIR